MKRNVKKMVSSFLVAMMVCAASFTSFAAETAQKTESVAAVDSEISVYAQYVSIPFYYYVVTYYDGGVYTSPIVTHTVSVPTGKKVYVEDPKAVYTTNTYNGVEVKSAVRYEYQYSFK